MKILFISSGNSLNGISPIVLNQGNSLIKLGHQVTFFTIKEKGLRGYAKSVLKLRKHLKKNNYDVSHAHYSLSAIVATLGGAKPLVVSLMGSDVKAKGYDKHVLHFFSKFFWDSLIVKSLDMKRSIGFGRIPVHIIPNGVDFDRFKDMNQEISLTKTHWDSTKLHILFAADPSRPEKNFKIAKEAFQLLDPKKIDLHYLKDISNIDIPYYMNSADVILLTSLWEGSPNVIKEAMACSRPIVATDVGDVKEVIGNTTGCYVANFNKMDIANKIEKALKIKKTSGREDISLLESSLIAHRIIQLYSSNLNLK